MGDTYEWVSASGTFGDLNNWEDATADTGPPAGPPGPSDTAQFDDSGNTIGGTGNVGTLNIGLALTFTGAITADTVSAGDGNETGAMTVTVSGGTLTGSSVFDVSAAVTVNIEKSGTIASGFLAIDHGGIVDITDGTVDAAAVEDSGKLFLVSGSVDATEVFEVTGDGVSSLLDIEPGTTLTDGSGMVGEPLAAGSVATVQSGGTWINNDNMTVGLGSAGTVDIAEDASVSVLGGGPEIFALGVGVGTGGDGLITITGGTLSVTGSADIGVSAAGNVSVTDGGMFSVTGTLDDGADAGGSGTLSVSDAGAAMTIGTWIIGDAGAHDDSIAGSASVDVTGSLSIGVQSTGDGTLTVSGSATLSVGGDATVGGDGDGTLTISGSATVTNTGALVVGALDDGDGTITLTSGTSLQQGGDVTVGGAGSGSIDIGQGTSVSLSGALTLADQADSDGTISFGQDVTLEPGGNLTVGNAGTASVTLAAGATLDGSAGAFMVGGTVGGAGTITLGGAQAEVAANALTVGGVGTGVISIGEDTTLDAGGDLTLGMTHGGGNGMITVAGSGDLSVGGNLTVGAGGIGSLDVNDGSLSIGGGLTIANGNASSGDVTFADASLTLDTMTVGNSGTATFSADQTADVTATNIVLGAAGVGNGTFNLDGAGSEVQASQLSVGGGGTGALQITDSASFQVSGLATMGASAGAKVQETATIETNASWTIGGILDVGQKAIGQITVDSGGQVAAAQSVVIGDTTKASGTVTVTGTGTLPSALGFGSLMQVGNDGVGTLALAAGAQAGVGTGSSGGVVEIGATLGATGLVTLSGTGTELQSQVLAVGGNEAGSGGAGTLDIGSKSEVSVADATVWVTGTVVMTGGTLATDPLSMQGALSGSGLVSGAVDNIGGMVANGGTLELSGSITGDGGLEVSSGAELRLAVGVAATETIGMATSGAVLRLGKLAKVLATVTGFAQGDTIVLDGVTADAGSFSANTLTLTEAGKSVGTLAMNGSYSSSEFHVVTVTGGSDVTIVPCFAAGVRILTVSGEVAVEALAPGDLVVTRSGRLRPVQWLGYRRVEPARHPRPWQVSPVRVRENAFAPGVPHGDLLLSPDHAVYWEGALIPVRYLCNGTTIRQEPAAAIVYYHVELDAHDVLIADGLLAESFLDTGNRGAFENVAAPIQAHADFARRVWRERGCAPLVVAGPMLAAAKRKILDRAIALGHAQTARSGLCLLADGMPVWPEIDGDVHRFTLSHPAAVFRLASRHAVPAEMLPDSTDGRRLGVAVARLMVDGREVAADDPRRMAGWYPPEPGWQWTDGDALLHCGGARQVAVTLLPLLRYWRPRTGASAARA